MSGALPYRMPVVNWQQFEPGAVVSAQRTSENDVVATARFDQFGHQIFRRRADDREAPLGDMIYWGGSLASAAAFPRWRKHRIDARSVQLYDVMKAAIDLTANFAVVAYFETAENRTDQDRECLAVAMQRVAEFDPKAIASLIVEATEIVKSVEGA